MQSVVLKKAVAAYRTDRFIAELQAGLAALGADQLCLHQATVMGGHVDADQISVTVLSVVDEDAGPVARVGVFFNEVLGGCSCHDDPVATPAYCELDVGLDAGTGEVMINHVPEV